MFGFHLRQVISKTIVPKNPMNRKIPFGAINYNKLSNIKSNFHHGRSIAIKIADTFVEQGVIHASNNTKSVNLINQKFEAKLFDLGEKYKDLISDIVTGPGKFFAMGLGFIGLTQIFSIVPNGLIHYIVTYSVIGSFGAGFLYTGVLLLANGMIIGFVIFCSGIYGTIAWLSDPKKQLEQDKKSSHE